MSDQKIYPANGLAVNFFGIPNVLNDGKSANTLKIALTNNNFFDGTPEESNIVFTEETPFFIKVLTDVKDGTDEDVRFWALMEATTFQQETVKLSVNKAGFEVSKITKSTKTSPATNGLLGWEITPTETVTLLPGRSLILTVEGIVTDLEDGPTPCYCTVKMPNTRRGKVHSVFTLQVGSIMKSSTVFTNDRVGIGTGKPGSTLDVNGAVRARGGKPGLGDEANNGFFFNGVGDNDSGMSSEGNGMLNFFVNDLPAVTIQQESVTVEKEIKVGGITHNQTSTEENITTDIYGSVKIMPQGNSGGDLQVINDAIIGDQLVAHGSVRLHEDLTVIDKTFCNGDLSVGGDVKLSPSGKVTVGELPPIVYQRRGKLTQTVTETNIPYKDYIAFVGGFQAMREKGSPVLPEASTVLMYQDPQKKDFWSIAIIGIHDGKTEKKMWWTVDVIAVHRSLIVDQSDQI